MAGLNLSKGQYLFLASAVKTLSEGIILGASGAFFLPETFQLSGSISLIRYILLLLSGLIILAFGVILEKKGEG